MANFLINTPYHKRWYLPDGRHQYNSVMFGDTVHISIIDSATNETKVSHYIKMEVGWEDLCDLSVELANKRYPKQLRHKSATPQRQRWGF